MGPREAAEELERGVLLAARYQIEKVIGTGGSGRVLQAFDRVTETPVALKILRPELASDPVWERRFSRELRLGRQLQHPNVCRVFDIGEAEGHLFLSMELAERGTIRAQLRPGAPARLFAERLIDARAVIQGVAAIHAAGIVHRDIKPENILRMADGRLVVTDFGLSLDPGTGPTTVIVGTPAYMAPEVVMGESVTMRSDVWSLGVVLHELLFARRPEWQVVHGHRRLRSPVDRSRSRMERRLAELCARCVSELPDDRPADATEVAKSLHTIGGGGGIGVSRRRWRRARTLGWGLLAAATLSTLTVFGDRFWHSASASLSDGRKDLSRILQDTGSVPLRESQIVATFPSAVRCVVPLAGRERFRVIHGKGTTNVVDFDVATGARRDWPMNAETLQSGCPQWSPDGSRVLYERPNSNGVMSIWAADEHGNDGAALVTGSGPLWLNSEEFAFNIDLGNVAVFAIPTKKIRILPEPEPSSKKNLAEKLGGAQTGRLTVRYLLVTGDWLAATYRIPEMDLQSVNRFPASTRKLEASANDGMLVASVDDEGSRLIAVAPGLLKSQMLARTADREIGHVALLGTRSALFSTSSVTTKVQVVLGDRQARTISTLPYWGLFPSMGASGNILLQVSRGSRDYVVRIDGRTGAADELTRGPSHLRPTFGADEDTYFYTDMSREVLVSCSVSKQTCQPLPKFPDFPVAAAQSPDRRHLAYFAMHQSPRAILWLDQKRHKDLGTARVECAPVWEGSDKLWLLRGSETERIWTRVVVQTGQTDLIRAAATVDESDFDCATSPFVPVGPYVRVDREEASDVRITAI